MTAFLVLAILAVPPADSWHTHYSKMFRVDPGPPNYVAHVSWYGTRSGGSKKTMIDLIELDGVGGKELITSTRIEGDPRIIAVSVHAYKSHEDFEDKQGRFHKFFPTWMLATKWSRGQHDHTTVWWFNPQTMRPTELLDVLNGDVSRLDKGIVEERTFSQYVDRREWPAGVRDIGKPVRRTWQMAENELKFVPGLWCRG
ncbi:MAG: hypothetical protein KF784_05875 [Fimbriimonadaceae bacterium]|nr:hypothetical protein [Fimbriimonadaceae bacterium]